MKRTLTALVAALVVATGVVAAAPAPAAQAATAPCSKRAGFTVYAWDKFGSLPQGYGTACIYKSNSSAYYTWDVWATANISSRSKRYNKSGKLTSDTGWSKATSTMTSGATGRLTSSDSYATVQFRIVRSGTTYYTDEFKLKF